MIVAALANQTLKETKLSREQTQEAVFKAKNPAGTLPLLETKEGTIGTSTAIIRFLCQGKPELLGSTQWEQAQVDQWLTFVRNEVWPAAKALSMHLYGQLELNEQEHGVISKELKDHLKTLNSHMKGKEYLTGKNLTVADVWLAITLQDLFQIVLDKNFRNSMNNLKIFFKKVTTHPAYLKRMGAVKEGDKHLPPTFKKKAAPAASIDKAQKKGATKQTKP